MNIQKANCAAVFSTSLLVLILLPSLRMDKSGEGGFTGALADPPPDVLAARMAALAADEDGAGDACVLIVLFRRRLDGALSVLLTQRSSSLNTHAGEVAFPGKKEVERLGKTDG